ncbi:MAG: 3'-5' exonuclease, partial [Gammaproteobacteria bacterium]|nr:3'-5' exonuclease [Gammaproteobacteria bacterium]
NGGGFDLPVLHYRALIHGIESPTYWDTGQHDSQFRFNNYLSRFHQRHTDLMDVLSGYQPRASASLEEMALLCGFPGKLGMSGARVWEAYQAGEIESIRNYCETDALNTYLLYLRFERIRGHLDPSGYEREIERLRAHLRQDGRAHMQAFLEAWPQPVNGA